MQRTITAPTTSLESKDTTKWGGITKVLLELIFNNTRDARDLVNLCQVNKLYRKVGLSKNTDLGFFSKSYSYNQFIKKLMLSPDRISAPHVRAGNQLIKQALNKLHQGDFIIDALLDRAMYNHGSYLAMALISMLSTLPGRIKLNFSMNALIKLYHKKTYSALQREITLAFQADENCDQYVEEMKSIFGTFSDQIFNKYIPAFKHSYHSQTSFQNAYHQVPDEYTAHRPPLISKNFDAAGFIGYQEPCRDNVWYLQTASQKEFIKTQKIIDNSFAQLTSAHQHPRITTG